MRNRMIKAGCAIPSMKVSDVTYNVQEIIALMKSGKDCGVLVFPELCITGYTCADLFNQDLLLKAAEQGLKTIAEASKKHKGTTFIVGVPLRYENSLYNCAAFVSEGVIAGIVPKVNVPSYSEFYELRWFTSGKDVYGKVIHFADQDVPFGIDVLAEDPESHAVIGIDICEDLWVPDRPSTHAALAGANLIANLSASDEVIGKADYRRNLVLHQSADCYLGYIYTSAATDESSTDLVFSGHSMIASNGKMLAEMIYPERPALKTAVIDLEALEYNRMHQNTFVNEANDWYRRVPVKVKPLGGSYETSTDNLVKLLKKESYHVNRMPFVPKDDKELAERCAKILQIQANGLATRVRATNIKTLVIGVSGGLDSTL
ncbi:MAG: NAD(+) synthase, partial [Solobacterium sp.]|nr:NAD(+) synthase [Solobacterium sp.]